VKWDRVDAHKRPVSIIAAKFCNFVFSKSACGDNVAGESGGKC
jgi:hypothetical protein